MKKLDRSETQHRTIEGQSIPKVKAKLDARERSRRARREAQKPREILIKPWIVHGETTKKFTTEIALDNHQPTASINWDLCEIQRSEERWNLQNSPKDSLKNTF